MEEEVVIIQEEEMVLVCKEHQPHDEQQPQDEQEQEPQPKCTEPESTVSAPSKPKYKKKQQKRK